jgi:hypothetical protein
VNHIVRSVALDAAHAMPTKEASGRPLRRYGRRTRVVLEDLLQGERRPSRCP